MNTLKWTIFILFSVIIGVYPFLYLLVDMSQGFPATKEPELLTSKVWLTALYIHIIPGGFALLAGWSQFNKRIRKWNIDFHRNLGRLYLITVAVSGIAGLYLALHATGGLVSTLGFGGLGMAWLYTSLRAYQSIRKKDTQQHQYWMIRSYALCWAAVMLRLYIPLFQLAGMEYLGAYRIIAWLCWVPNLVVAEIIINSIKRDRQVRASRLT